MLKQWQAMQSSSIDDSGEDADIFERLFYIMTAEIKEWYKQLPSKPKTLEQAFQLPLIAEIEEELPAPLLLNFETEIEMIVEGIEREED
ncbi:hypothetical protein KH400_17195 [Desertibacillus haloalkaliphilus]|nr:hypothetical protein [Desertibacillus haloalkaliphilus]